MTEELHDWQKEFKLKGSLTQLDVENFERSLFTFPRRLLANTGAGAELKAAIEGGWILAPTCEVGDFEGEKRYFYNEKNVDEMHPGAVKWLGERVDDAYQEATEIPKNL
jgi:hypothetical protein